MNNVGTSNHWHAANAGETENNAQFRDLRFPHVGREDEEKRVDRKRVASRDELNFSPSLPFMQFPPPLPPLRRFLRSLNFSSLAFWKF